MKPFVFALCALSAILACSAGILPEGRIAGGDDAVLGQIPYQAALRIGGSPICGVTILSENYGLTAIHCVCSEGKNTPWPPQVFTVSAGSVDLYTARTDVRVLEIKVNPNYSNLKTGIVLLKFEEPFIFSDKIQAIPLARENPPVGAEVEISGWGRLKSTDENMYRTLQINEAEVLTESECQMNTQTKDKYALCLSNPRKNGICRGDFGGPAVYQGKLVGTAAYVLGECGSYLPDVFTSAAMNYDWIVENMTP